MVKDEVFHIRQAQAYLQGQWRVWDPKITTPPALYVVSYVQMRLAQLVGYDKVQNRDFRSINSLVTFELVFVVLSLVRRISSHERSPGQTKKGWIPSTAEVHTVVNIMLFPPLFFFYGLYYTDVLSVRSVLIVYYYHLDHRRGSSIAAAGMISLAFRQTNVFWVAIYIGGLELQRVLPRRIELNHSPNYKKWLQEHSSGSSFRAIVKRTWISGRVYDPPMSDASMEGTSSKCSRYGRLRLLITRYRLCPDSNILPHRCIVPLADRFAICRIFYHYLASFCWFHCLEWGRRSR